MVVGGRSITVVIHGGRRYAVQVLEASSDVVCSESRAGHSSILDLPMYFRTAWCNRLKLLLGKERRQRGNRLVQQKKCLMMITQ